MINPLIKIKELIKKGLDKYRERPTDWTLLGAIGFLIFFGLAALSSAGVATGFQVFGDSYWHFKHQIVYGFLPGLVVFSFFYFFNYQRLKKYAFPALIISVALLIMVFIPGIGSTYGTAKSWVNIFGFSIQPSEIVKLTFLLYLATWLSQKEERHLRDFQYGFLPFVFILVVVVFLIALEPDFGTMSIILIMSIAVYFVAGGRWRHLIGFGLVGLAGLLFMVKISPYRAARFTTFLHPELDPQGIGYHINQALLAVGSGGWLGRGFGHSRQKFAYLPEVTGDSIFAVVSEEMGFFITAIIVVVFAFIAIRGMKLAAGCRDPFARLIVVGIIVWFVFQAFLNIGSIIGILPMTGVPLPFISYGGTALMMCMGAAGILANISKQAD